MAKYAVSNAVCQGNALCPAGCINTCALAQKLKRRYAGAKVRIGIFGCRNSCLRSGTRLQAYDLSIYGGQAVCPDDAVCIRCGSCVKKCPSGALSLSNGKLQLKSEKCLHCGICARACPVCAFSVENGYLLSDPRLGNHDLQFFRQEEELLENLDNSLGRK